MTVCAVLLAGLAATAAPASADHEQAGAEYPVDHVGAADGILARFPKYSVITSIVPDDTRRQVFTTGTPGLSVVSTDQTTPMRTAPGVVKPQTATMLPDGRHLVALEWGGHRADIIDAATLRVTRYVQFDGDVCPQSAVSVSGLVFFSYALCEEGTGEDADVWETALGAFDPTTGHTTLGLRTFADDFPAGLTPIPGQAAFIAGTEHHSTPYTYVFETTGGASPTLTQRAELMQYDLQRGAVSPDGTRLVAPVLEPGGVPIYSTADLSLIGRYNTLDDTVINPAPTGTAFRSDGRLAVQLNGTHWTDVMIFGSTDTERRIRSLDYGYGPGAAITSRYAGVEFGAVDAYVVTYTNTDFPMLRRVRSGSATPMSLSTDRVSYRTGAPAIVTVRLARAATNRQVRLYVTEAGGARRLVAQGNVDGTGQFRARLPMRRNVTLQADFAGDLSHGSATAARRVPVAARTAVSVTPGRLRTGWVTVRPRTHPTVQLRVFSPNPGGCASARVQRLAGGHWRTIRTTNCLPLDRASATNLRINGTYAAGTRLRVAARFNGSAANTPSPWTWARIKYRR